MDINFTCAKCGQNIIIDEKGAGMAAQCPTCAVPLQVPLRREGSPSSLSPQIRTDDLKTCPRCAEDVKKAAKICRFCGYDFQTEQPDSKSAPQQPVTPQSAYDRIANKLASVGKEKPVHGRSSIMDGVRLGFGMFVVLPIIVVLILVFWWQDLLACFFELRRLFH
jgi:transcription elongation factor Elf1